VGGGSGGIYGQIYGSATDRLRNHALLVNFAVYGNFKLIDGLILYINQGQRLIWGGGPFHSLRFRFDRSYADLGIGFSWYERFYGALASLRYPFSRFSYFQTDISIGGSTVFLDSYTAQSLLDPALNPAHLDLLTPWQQRFAGTHFQTEVDASFGFDSLRYAMGYVPIAGSSFLFTAGTTVQPFRSQAAHRLRLDAAHYFHLFGQASFLVRTSLGSSFGGILQRDFYLSSFDTLRGVNVGDTFFLLGKYYYYANAEFILPLNALIHVFPFSGLQGVAGVDFGGVAPSLAAYFNRRVLDAVLGVNLALGALIFRLRPPDQHRGAHSERRLGHQLLAPPGRLRFRQRVSNAVRPRQSGRPDPGHGQMKPVTRAWRPVPEARVFPPSKSAPRPRRAMHQSPVP
jgi:hypothetical protein